MKSIFIVTDNIPGVDGQAGIPITIKQLATYGGYDKKQYPAFKSGEDAKKFIDELDPINKPEITELPIWDGE